MYQADIKHSFVEILAGTNAALSSAYMEAAKSVENSDNKAMATLKNFLTSIEKLSGGAKDARISESKGNLKQFKGYENIQTVMDFTSKNLSGIVVLNDLKKIQDTLESNQPQYTDGYQKQSRLVMLEYESGVYLLVTGLAMVMSNSMEVVQNGEQIKIQKRQGDQLGVIGKTISDFAKQISTKEHKQYLEEMNKSRETKPVDTKVEAVDITFTEGAVADTIDLIDSMFDNIAKIGAYTRRAVTAIKNSVFGIVPLIQTVLYLRYKKKADTVLALEQQAAFIEQNTEILKNRTNMDPKKKALIIKKQKAIADGYMKKAAKLRAQLTETEKEVATEIKDKPSPVASKKDEDDFVLERAGVGSFSNT